MLSLCPYTDYDLAGRKALFAFSDRKSTSIFEEDPTEEEKERAKNMTAEEIAEAKKIKEEAKLRKEKENAIRFNDKAKKRTMEDGKFYLVLH